MPKKKFENLIKQWEQMHSVNNPTEQIYFGALLNSIAVCLNSQLI